MSIARYLTKLGALLNSSGQVATDGLQDSAVSTAKLANLAATTAKIADANVTQAKLETLVVPIGVGQTWQDVTASRALGTTYTNSTGRPIFINVWCSTGSSTTELILTVDGSAVTMDAGIWGMSFSAVIPSGSTYSASGGTKQKWRELR